MTYIVWPGAVVIVAIVFLLIFATQIGRLIDRTQKISKAGLEVSPTVPETAKSQEERIERRPSGFEDLMAPFDNALLREQEQAILKDLDARRIDDRSAREKILVRYLASSTLFSRLQASYSTIFGSQISALQTINAGKTTKGSLFFQYQTAAVLHPDFYNNYNFDQWLQYMVNDGLVGVSTEGEVTITLYGREFLLHITRMGLSAYKLY